MEYPFLNGQNITFFAENDLVDTYTLSLTTGTAAANHPLTELQNESVKLTFKTTTAGTTVIQGDYPGTYPFSAGLNRRVGFGILNHNFGITTLINIKLYDTSLTLKVNQTFNATNYPFGGRLDDIINSVRPYQNRVGYITDFTPGFTLRRWVLQITDASPSVSYWEIGRLFLGPVFQPKDNFSWDGVELSTVDTSKVAYSDGKDTSTDLDPISRALNITPPLIKANPETDVLEWGRLLYLTGKRFKVLVDPYPHYPDIGSFPNTPEGRLEAYHNIVSQVYGTLEGAGGISRTADGGVESARVNGRFTLVESLG